MDEKATGNNNDKISENLCDKKCEKANGQTSEKNSEISFADLSFHIRRATIEDCQAIVKLEQECFHVPWSEKSIKDDLANNNKAYYYVAIANSDKIDNNGEIANNGEITNNDVIANSNVIANSDVIGYIGMWLVVDDAQITNVAVSEQYRRKGVANALLRYLCCVAKKMKAVIISLEVSDANTSAISLYLKEGFVKVGIRKKYYEKIGQDAIIMLKNIEQ